MPPGRPGERWITCWTLAWVRLEAGWQPGVVHKWVRAGPDQPWLVQIEYEAVRMGRRERGLSTLVYDPQFIRPMPLPDPPGD